MVSEVVVHLAAGRGYVWSADDVKLLREQRRFIGALIGPNTGNTHQEHMPHSLPLLLMPEELQLGLKRGWFLIAPDPLPLAVLLQAPAPTPTPEDLERLSEERPQSQATGETHTSQPEGRQPNAQSPATDRILTSVPEAEKREGESAIIDTEHPAVASGRVVEDETVESKNRRADDEVSSSPSALEDRGEVVPGGVEDTTVGGDDDAGSEAAAAPCEPSAPASQPAKKKKGSREEEYWLSFAGTTQKNVLTKSPSSIDTAMPGVPAPPHEESDRYVVYEDMYIRGYTITSGTNFGGNFLAYAGDPMDYHSEFVVRVLSKASRIPYPSLSAASRVALTARKKFLIALVTRKEGGSEDWERQVQYLVIAPDLVTASGVSRGLRAVPPPPPRKKT